MDKRKRLFISVLRGTTIFLMLWGHAIQYCSQNSFDFYENKAYQIIYSFHMPLLMLISGYLFYFSLKKRTLSEIVKNRIQSLLHPIFTGTILFFVFTTILVSFLNGNLKAYENIGESISELSQMWFLWSVLSCSLAVGIACKTTNSHLVHAILLCFGYFFVNMFPDGKMNGYMYPFFVIGFLFAQIPDCKIKKIIIKFRYVSLILFPIMTMFYRKEHLIYISASNSANGFDINELLICLYRWIIGLVGCVFAITVIGFLFNIVYKISRNQRLIGFIAKIGDKSLQIYVLQRIFLESYLGAFYEKLVALAGYNFLASNMIIYNLVFTPLIALFYAIALLLLIRLLEKTKISKLLFGR